MRACLAASLALVPVPDLVPRGKVELQNMALIVVLWSPTHMCTHSTHENEKAANWFWGVPHCGCAPLTSTGFAVNPQLIP